MSEIRICDELCDADPVDYRAEKLKEYIFPDIFEKTHGLFSLEWLKKAKNIVDIGCGRGAVGLVMRQLGIKNKIYGIDVNYPYSDKNAYGSYTDVSRGDIRDKLCKDIIFNSKSDLIIGVGLPSHINSFIITNINDYNLNPNGKLLLVTEYDLNIFAGGNISVFEGVTEINKSILVYENK